MNKRFTYWSRADKEKPGQKYLFSCILSTWESVCAIGFFHILLLILFFILGFIWDYLVLDGSLLFDFNNWCLIFLIPLCWLCPPFVFAHKNWVKGIIQAKTHWHFHKTSYIDLLFQGDSLSSMCNILYCTSIIIFNLLFVNGCCVALPSMQSSVQFILEDFCYPLNIRRQYSVYGTIRNNNTIHKTSIEISSNITVCITGLIINSESQLVIWQFATAIKYATREM